MMDLIISNASEDPIYEQIYNQIKEQILSGKLASGDVLPSIRSLARDLRISVITTKRAYDELEKDGFIDTVAGKGCFIASKNMALLREINLKEIEEHMKRIHELAVVCGISEDGLVEIYRLLTEDMK